MTRIHATEGRCMFVANAETHRWSIEEFERLHAQGFLPQQARVELIEGEIVHMPPMLPPHASSLMKATGVFVRLFEATHWIRVQCPLDIPRFSQPEPDFALVRRDGFNVAEHPTAADLLVEVSDSSLLFDRGEKASLYARGGFAELWIVNLQDGVLEVLREPRPSPRQPYGYAYQMHRVCAVTESVAPLFAPDVAVLVADLVS